MKGLFRISTEAEKARHRQRVAFELRIGYQRQRARAVLSRLRGEPCGECD